MSMTETEVRRVARITVEETLTSLGLDMEHPLEVQRDLQYVRDLRTTVEAVKRRGLMTAVGVLVTFACGIVALGIKEYFTG